MKPQSDVDTTKHVYVGRTSPCRRLINGAAVPQVLNSVHTTTYRSTITPVAWQSLGATPVQGHKVLQFTEPVVPRSEPAGYRELPATSVAEAFRIPTPTFQTRPQSPQPTLRPLAPAENGANGADGAPQAAGVARDESPRHTYQSTKVTFVYPPVRLEPTTAMTAQTGGSACGSTTPRLTPRFVSGAGSVPVPPLAATILTPPVPSAPSNVKAAQAATAPAPPAPPCVVAVTTRLTPRSPVTLPAKLVSISRSPAPCVLRSDARRAEVTLDSPRPPSPRVVRTRVTLDSPRPPSPRVRTRVSSPHSVTTRRDSSPLAARTSALEERLKELERRLDAKETECKMLEHHLTEVRGCLEEQRERGARDLEQRDLHIQELSRRNNDLIREAQGMYQVVQSTVDDPAMDEETAPKDINLHDEESEVPAAGGGSSRQRAGRPGSEASQLERDLPTLAALRQRLYPKRSAQTQQESAADAASLERSSERSARPTPRPSTGRGRQREELGSEKPRGASDQQTPKRRMT
ncbi:unnamed protein product [Symbiodinium pilosum]|uniref:Uncharacterized protein n=1 Tax=Symbiodinium pilosum TaxID=2952 RepID=A0A812SWT2_SYMPI|nr:unnamed protein product [Symbiodinium pilosum]